MSDLTGNITNTTGITGMTGVTGVTGTTCKPKIEKSEYTETEIKGEDIVPARGRRFKKQKTGSIEKPLFITKEEQDGIDATKSKFELMCEKKETEKFHNKIDKEIQ